MSVMCFSVLLLQKTGKTEVHLSTERGEYRMAALFLLLMWIITSLGCGLLYWKLESCQIENIRLVKLEGEYNAITKNQKTGTTSEVTTTSLEDKLLKLNEDAADKRVNEWKERAESLEQQQNNLRMDLLNEKDKNTKTNNEYLKCSKLLEDCREKSESSSRS